MRARDGACHRRRAAIPHDPGMLAGAFTALTGKDGARDMNPPGARVDTRRICHYFLREVFRVTGFGSVLDTLYASMT